VPNRTFAVRNKREPVLRVYAPVLGRLDPDAPPSANERFKTTFGTAFRVGVLAAIVSHFVLILVFPSVPAARLPVAAPRLAAIDIPPRVSIPAAPEPVSRPARPTIGAPPVARTLTIEPTTFESFEPAGRTELAPPPVPTAREDGRPTYIPFEVAPRLMNRAVAATLLEQVYPDALRDAGISGSVQLWIYIDESGTVRDCRVAESSGYEELDIAATTVAYAMEFTPALMRDKAAAVWIAQPIDFIAR
jgi:TonB family protein